MAEAFIEEIYLDAMILYQMKRAVSEGNKGLAVSAFEHWSHGGEILQKRVLEIRKQDAKTADLLWNTAQYCREAHADLLLFIARIEGEMIPLLMQYLQGATGIDTTEGRWNLISSRSSFLSIRDLTRSAYLHSPYDPMWESYELVQDFYDPTKHVYHILGCGLGYIPYVLWEESDQSLEIYLYENDADILQYACSYGVLDWINPGQLHVIFEADPNDLLEKFLLSRVEHPDQGSFISPWKREELRTEYDQDLSDEYTNDLGRRLYNRIWDINRTNNHLKAGLRSMKELQPGAYKKEWVVVAAGPSVDENMEFLRESQGKRTIIAVNTILRKLVKAGIRPDLLTVLDPTAEVATHLDGVEEATKDIPLLAEQLTNWHYIERYQGPVYLIISANSVFCVSEDERKDIEPWSVGGTVSSLAVTAAIRLGAERVYLVGLDLGYPGHKRYADDSPYDPNGELQESLETDSVDGGFVVTNETFEFFRSSIEKDILAHPQVKFVNRSMHGAYIRGTMMDRWWEKTKDLQTPEDRKAYLKRFSEGGFLTWRRRYYLFWQVITGMDESEREQLREELDAVYADIYRDFTRELNWTPSHEGKASGLTYIFSLHYEHSGSHPMSVGLKREAFQAVQAGEKPLLVSTEEYLSGEKIALEQSTEKSFDGQLKNAEEIQDGNRRYPYYMFPENMPELRFIREFLNFMDQHRPVAVRKTAPYSLTADYAEECFGKKN